MEFNKGGRPQKPKDEKSVKFSSSLPHDLYLRLKRYCDSEERDIAYVLRKCVDPWLKKQGF